MTKYLVAPKSLRRGNCAAGDSLGEGWESPLIASQAFEHLLALHSHDEGAGSSLEPIRRTDLRIIYHHNCNHGEKDIFLTTN